MFTCASLFTYCKKSAKKNFCAFAVLPAAIPNVATDRESTAIRKILTTFVRSTLIFCIFFSECNEFLMLTLYLAVPSNGYYRRKSPILAVDYEMYHNYRTFR